MKAIVTVTLAPGIRDPEGETIQETLETLGFADLRKVSVGRVYELEIDSSDPERVLERAQVIGDRLLGSRDIEKVEVRIADGEDRNRPVTGSE